MAFAVIPILSLDKDGATSTLLSFGGINVLFDCGLTNINHMQKYDWSSKNLSADFDEFKYDYHATLMNKLDIILISRADLQYSGAYPFICSKYNFKGRAFSTVPSKHLSMIIFRMLVLRLFPKELFNQEQTKRFFSKVFKIQDAIEGVCFSDKRNFEINGRHIDITAFNCGNSIGGAMWRLCIETFSVG